MGKFLNHYAVIELKKTPKDSIYIMLRFMVQKEIIFREQKLTSKKEVPIIMNKFYSIDVDDKSDLIIAENYLKYLKKVIKK